MGATVDAAKYAAASKLAQTSAPGAVEREAGVATIEDDHRNRLELVMKEEDEDNEEADS